MTTRGRQWLAMLLAVSGEWGLFAQSEEWKGPVLGLTFAPASGDVRLVLGSPGAALEGAAIPMPAADRNRIRTRHDEGLEQIAVSPSGGSALISSARAATLRHIVPSAGGFEAREIRGTAGGPAALAYSPSGSFAVVFYPASKTFQVLATNGDSAESVRSWQAPDLKGEVSAIAISDDGQSVLAGLSGVIDGESLLLWRKDAALPEVIEGFVSPASIAFFPGSADAAVGDAQTRTVTRIQDVVFARGTELIAGPDQGLYEPSALRVAGGGGLLLIADRKARLAGVVQLESGEFTLLRCECIPVRLEPLLDNGLFRITDSGGGPLWMLDVRETPALRFVPSSEPRQ